MKKYLIDADQINSLIFALCGEDVKGKAIEEWLNEFAEKAIAPHIEAGAGLKPTKLGKNHLPDDVKLLFHKGIGLYQCIQNYELGVVTKDKFIGDMRKVESEFKQDTPAPF